jgi:hypothetical protein
LARKKKSKPFRAVTAVKAAARVVVGTVPATRRDPDTKKKSAGKTAKHKPTLQQMLQEKD